MEEKLPQAVNLPPWALKSFLAATSAAAYVHGQCTEPCRVAAVALYEAPTRSCSAGSLYGNASRLVLCLACLLPPGTCLHGGTPMLPRRKLAPKSAKMAGKKKSL